MAGTAISTTDLRKTYRQAGTEIRAVDGLTFEVRTGEFFGLLGPNGAGKSTTLGMLTTRVRPTAGEARIADIDVVADPVSVKRRIGVVTQHNTLDRQLTAAENLEFRGRYSGMTASQARVRAAELLESFGLESRAEAVVHRLSGGQAQRLLIARALMHRPHILFLDEPTSGLDPQTRVNLWSKLSDLHAQGQTIVLTTHYLEEAEGLCQRVGVVDKGRLLACDTVDALKDSVGGETVFTLRLTPDAAPLAEVAEHLDGVSEVSVDGGTLRVRTLQGDGVLGRLVQAAADAGLTTDDVHIVRPSLESVFLALTGREYRE